MTQTAPQFKMKKQKTKCLNCKSYKIKIRENYPFGKKSNPVRTIQCKRCGEKIK